MPEQQHTVAYEDARTTSEDSGRHGRRDAELWRSSTRHGGSGMLRELAREGVLEREDVRSLLRRGPLHDFRTSVLQVNFYHAAPMLSIVYHVAAS